MADFKGFHKTPMGQNKMKLKSHRWGDTWKRGSLDVEMMGNNPRLTCWPRNPAEEGKVVNGVPLDRTPIVAAMDLLEHLKFLNYFEKMILAGKTCSMGFNSKKQKEGSEDKFEKEIKTKVVYGIDVDGRPFITIRTKDREPVPFGFEPNVWSETIDVDGEPMEPRKQAIDDALTWIQAQRLLFGAVNVACYDPDLQNGFTDKDKPQERKPWNTPQEQTYQAPQAPAPQQAQPAAPAQSAAPASNAPSTVISDSWD